MSTPDTKSAITIGVVELSSTGGYRRFEVAKTGGGYGEIDTVVLYLMRNQSTYLTGDFSNATLNTTSTTPVYQVETDNPTDGKWDFMIYDNDNNTMLTKGDVILIDKSKVNTGDELEMDIAGQHFRLYEFVN